MTIGRIPSVEGGIQPTIVDAKGDLIAAVAADSVNRLAVGSNDQVLVADSAASTGLAWKSYGSQLSSSNPVLNSAMDIWQRGTSIAVTANVTNAYTADRWLAYRAVSGSTVSRQTTSDTTNLPFVQYCARVQRDSGNTATNLIDILQMVETTNTIPFAGKTVTLSFYARKGANFSAASDALTFRLVTGTGTDQNAISPGYTGNATVISSTATLTTTWQRFTATGTISSSATEMFTEFYFTPVGTAGAADFFEITGVQIDVGSVAQPFRRNSVTIQGELAACQRYYWRTGGDSVYNALGNGLTLSTTAGSVIVKLPVTMRIKPSSMDFSTLAVYDGTAVTAINAATLIANNSAKDAAYIDFTVVSGLTANRPVLFITNNSTSGYLGLNAEL
jgi:hypothetical protein